jgi:hypothetical protein
MRRTASALALGLAMAASPVGAFQLVPVAGKPVCARLNYVATGSGTLVVTTDDERLLTVSAAAASGDRLADLNVGEGVILVGVPGADPDRFVATSVRRQAWRGERSAEAWQCFHGHVLSADWRSVMVRAPDGAVVTVERREAIQDTVNLVRGQRVTVVGVVRSMTPPRMSGRYIVLEQPGGPLSAR